MTNSRWCFAVVALAFVITARAESGCDDQGSKLMSYLNSCLGEVPVKFDHGIQFPTLPLGQGAHARNYCYNAIMQTSESGGARHVDVCQVGKSSSELKRYTYLVPKMKGVKYTCFKELHGQSFLYNSENSRQDVALVMDYSTFHCDHVLKTPPKKNKILAPKDVQEINCATSPVPQALDMKACSLSGDTNVIQQTGVGGCENLVQTIVENLHGAIMARAKVIQAQKHSDGNFARCKRLFDEAVEQLDPSKNQHLARRFSASEQKLIEQAIQFGPSASAPNSNSPPEAQQ